MTRKSVRKYISYSKHFTWKLLLTAVILSSLVSVLYAQTETGYASFYAKRFTGLKTASGERLNNDSLTCAHKTFPFGTYLKVTNLTNHKTVTVRVNDRGPFTRGRIIDLTLRAANELEIIGHGTSKVSVEVVYPIVPPLAIPEQERSQPEIPKIWEMTESESAVQWPIIEPVWLSEP